MSRVLDFADGFTSAGSPTSSDLISTKYAEYANEAAFVSANGTAVDGNVFYDTTLNKVKIYENGAWVENSSFEP